MQKFGDNVILRLSNAKEINAEITSIIGQEDGNVMIAFKINKAVQELISYRKITIDVVWWSYEGLKIPNSALIQERRFILCNKKQNRI